MSVYLSDQNQVLIILLSWDEKKGPIFIDSTPELNPAEGLKLGVQIYMIAASIFGSDEYNKEVVDLPIVNLGIRTRIWINYREDMEVRGGKRPFMLAVTYAKTDPVLQSILSSNDQFIDQTLEHYVQYSKIDLKFLHQHLQEQELLHFSTINEFYATVSKLSASVYFGLAAGTIIKAPEISNVNIDRYFASLPSNIPQGIVSQILVEELQEFWFSYWIGPFTFMFQPPIYDLPNFRSFINGMPTIVEKLWQVTLSDVNSKLDIVNILTRIVYNPEMLPSIWEQSVESANQKLTGKNLRTVDRFKNADVLFYIRSEAQRITKNGFDSTKLPKTLVSYSEFIDSSYWEGFLIVFGFFLGKELFSFTMSDLKMKRLSILEKIVQELFKNLSKWKISLDEGITIFSCPYCALSAVNKCNFFQGVLLAVFNHKKVVISRTKNESMNISLKF